MRRVILWAAFLATFFVAGDASATRITIQNNDGPNSGFNDTTPAQPVGGNSGTTRGEQRLIAFRHAAGIWERLIDSDVEIIVRATFSPIKGAGNCTDTSAVLGAATATHKVANFLNAPKKDVLYPIALANKIAGRDLLETTPDIDAFFNADVDLASCLGALDWYYGLDGNSGDDVDLVVVLLHEFAHGLGMSGSMNTSTGRFSQNMPNVFELHTLDLTTGLRFDQMTDEQRKAAAINGNQTVWDGPMTRQAAQDFLAATTVLSIASPDGPARPLDINPATFGPSIGTRPVAGAIVAAVDAGDEAGPATTDACSALTNASDLAGRIALVDRGTCTFVEKALRVQAAGAIGIVVVNNSACGLPPMGGLSGEVTIPAIGISKADGDAIRQELAGARVDGSLHLDPASRSGASPAGYVRLYVPCELEPGSSMYHWDISTTPNLLMEPFISDDLPHAVDITLQQLLDIGWTRPAPSGRRILRRGR